MQQVINNKGEIDKQFNINENNGSIYLSKQTRFAKRFKKLNDEIVSNKRCTKILYDFEYYNTKRDDLDMPSKLKDGGFNDRFIFNATKKKQKYAKKAERFKFFESAQWIDSQIFAKIKLNFDTYIEPLILDSEDLSTINKKVTEMVVNPILELINTEGEDDEILNYDAEDILGMIYFLTGKCHLNWTDYDNL